MTDPSLRFRGARPDDVDDLRALVELCYRGDASRQGWTSEADILAGPRTSAEEIAAIVGGPDSTMLCGERGGEMVACCQLLRRGPELAYAGMVCVRPDLQGRGFGRSVLAAAEDWVRREWGSSVLSMHVFSVRDELIAWYGRLGYQPTGEVVAFDPAPEAGALVEGLEFLVLAKSLEPAARSRRAGGT